jgi:hypothetical protein
MITRCLEETAAKSKLAAQTEAAARGSETLADFVLIEVKAVPEESLHWVVRLETASAPRRGNRLLRQ